MRVEVTKLYCVQVLDDEDNELDCEYVFGNKEYAKEVGRELKKRLTENK